MSPQSNLNRRDILMGAIADAVAIALASTGLSACLFGSG
jgi:hypothetical protein